jgi:hypothetical protein
VVVNDTPCDKCVERGKECEKRDDGLIGCSRCQISKLGCSLINRKKKNVPKTPKKSNEPKKQRDRSMDPDEIVLVGEMPRLMVEIVGECMMPFVDLVIEARKEREEMAGVRSEMARMANAMEEMVGLLRVKWSGDSAESSGVGAEAEKGSGEAEKGSGEAKTSASVPEESDSSDDSDDSEDSDKGEGEDSEDEDVDMEEGGSGGPIGIIGDPIVGPSSSAA